MLQNNTRNVVVALVDLQKQLTPLLERFEEEKEAARQIGAGIYEFEGIGKVSVSAASVSKPTGTKLELDPIAFSELTPTMKAKLVKLGIVKDVTIYSQNRKSSVKVEEAA